MAVVGFVLGSLYYSRRIPEYQSSAQLYVIKKQNAAVTGNGQEFLQQLYSDDLSSHLLLMKSYSLIQRALKKPELNSLPSLAGLNDPTSLIANSLTVTKDIGGYQSSVFHLSYRGTNPEDCRIILSAIVQSYQDFLDETYKKGSGDTQKLIAQARDVLQNQLEKKQAEYKEYRLKSPLISSQGKDSVNPHQEGLANIESRRLVLAVRRADIEGHLARIDKALKEGLQGPALLALATDLTSRTGADGARKEGSFNLEDQLLPLLIQEQELLEQYGPDHPKVKGLRKRMEMTRSMFTHPSSLNEAAGSADPKNDSGIMELVQSHTQSLKQELNDIEVSEKASPTCSITSTTRPRSWMISSSGKTSSAASWPRSRHSTTASSPGWRRSISSRTWAVTRQVSSRPPARGPGLAPRRFPS